MGKVTCPYCCSRYNIGLPPCLLDESPVGQCGLLLPTDFCLLQVISAVLLSTLLMLVQPQPFSSKLHEMSSVIKISTCFKLKILVPKINVDGNTVYDKNVFKNFMKNFQTVNLLYINNQIIIIIYF